MRTITLILIATLMTSLMTISPVVADHGSSGEIRDEEGNLIAKMVYKSAQPGISNGDPLQQTWTFTWYNMSEPLPTPNPYVPIYNDTVGVGDVPAPGVNLVCDAVGSIETGFKSVNLVVYENTYEPGGRKVGATQCAHAFETTGTDHAHDFPFCHQVDTHTVDYKVDAYGDGFVVHEGSGIQTVLGSSSLNWCEPIDPCDVHVPGDFATIQQALNAAVDDQLICLGEGTFEEAVSLPDVTNLTIAGAGSGETIIDAGGAAARTIEGEFGVRNVGLTLKGVTVTGSTAYGLKLFNAQNVTLRDVEATGNGVTGVDFHTVASVDAAGIQASFNGGNGIAIRNADGVRLNGATLNNNSWGGLAFYAPGGETVNGVTVSGSGFFGEGAGIYFQYDGYTNISIRENQFRDNDVGVLVDTTPDASGITLRFNAFLGNDVGAANTGTGTLDATNNYWNHVAGADHGDPVQGDVDTTPWCLTRGCLI